MNSIVSQLFFFLWQGAWLALCFVVGAWQAGEPRRSERYYLEPFLSLAVLTLFFFVMHSPGDRVDDDGLSTGPSLTGNELYEAWIHHTWMWVMRLFAGCVGVCYGLFVQHKAK
jgi:hypothetical protein